MDVSIRLTRTNSPAARFAIESLESRVAPSANAFLTALEMQLSSTLGNVQTTLGQVGQVLQNNVLQIGLNGINIAL